MANGKAPWDTGNFTFVGKGDPLSAENLGNSVSTVFVQPDADPAKVAKLKADGYQIGVWEQPPSQAGVDAVKKFGAVAYIGGAEGPGQYQNAMDIASQLGDLPKALYSNYPTIPSPDGKWPPGWDAMPEVYTNKDPSWNVSAKVEADRAAGAQDVVPIFGFYDATTEKTAAGLGGPSTYPLSSYINDSKAAGVRYFGTYAADTMQAQDYEALKAYGNNPITGGAGTAPPKKPPPGGINAPPKKPPVSSPGSNPRKPKPPISGTGPGPRKPKPPITGEGRKNIPPNAGISGQHYVPGVGGAPAAYTGGKSPIVEGKDKTFSFIDKKTGKVATITTTADGAQFEQVQGKTAYRIKKAAPPPGDKSLGGPPPTTPTDNKAFAAAVKQDSNSSSGPAYRTNSDWTGSNNTADDTKAGLDPTKVLEERPGSGGKTIYRMANGTYMAYDPATGKTTSAGTWNNASYVAASGQNPPQETAASTTGGDFLPAGSTPPAAPTNSPPKETAASTTGGDFLPAGTSTPAPPATPPPTIADPTSSQSSQSFTPDPIVPAACFPAGTMVLTPDGQVPIEQIRVGETVITWDTSHRKQVPSKVSEIFKHLHKPTIILTTTHGAVTTTDEHRFWTGDDWTKAQDLEAGTSHLLGLDDEFHKLVSIEDGPHTNVYNLHVTAPEHNYFADGYLVHNRKVDP